MSSTLAPSGPNLLFQPFTGSHWLLLDLSGSYWISPCLSLWLSMALCDSHSGSHWLSLPLSGILWPSLAHYCSLISRIQPLIGSQGPCSALIADATMTYFIPLCWLGPGWCLSVRFGAETSWVGSWLELDLPDHRPSHVVAPPPEAGSWSRACAASIDF